MSTDEPTRYTLPHTEITLTVPVKANSFKSMETHRGVAHTARLFIDGVEVGTIENEGNGGPTSLYTINEHRPAWKAVVDGARDHSGNVMTEEDLANDLTTEAEFTTVIASVARSRTKHAVRLIEKGAIHSGGEPVHEYELRIPDVVAFKRAVTITPESVPALFKGLKLDEATLRADVWDGSQWLPFFPRPE